DQPFLGERWIGYAHDEIQALETSETLRNQTSGLTELRAARLMITDMRAGEYLSTDEARAVAQLAEAVRVTRQGLDNYGVGLVASGEMDLVAEAGLNWHDIAAAVPIVTAAGGMVCDWSSAPLRDTGGPIQAVVAATPALAQTACQVLQG
ncbi:MAG: inositol monophosphatase family protein, partial [Pseudomonadota bacterium]